MNIEQQYKIRMDDLSRKEAENDLLSRQVGDAESRILDLADKADVVQEALTFLEDLSNSRRGEMKGKIEGVVTEALQILYGPEHSMEMSYAIKNNRSSMEIEVVKQTPDGEVRRSMGGFGLGVADALSVPLRLMILMGSGSTDKVCVLDECYKHLDPERVPLVGEFLSQMSESLGIQLIMCSHHDNIREFADLGLRVTQEEGVTNVESLS